MLALMSLLTDTTMAAELNPSLLRAATSAEMSTSQQGGLCLAKVDVNENECRAFNAESACPSRPCFWRQGYEEGKCWGKAKGGEACEHYNAKSDCDKKKLPFTSGSASGMLRRKVSVGAQKTDMSMAAVSTMPSQTVMLRGSASGVRGMKRASVWPTSMELKAYASNGTPSRDALIRFAIGGRKH